VKLLALIAIVGLAAVAQETSGTMKHLLVSPMNGSANGRATVSARSIERGAEYPSVIHLKGDVEIRTPVCFQAHDSAKTVCYGETVVHADEAEYHEDTGEIEPHGKVTVIPLRTEPKR
jgi:hypothetical protein